MLPYIGKTLAMAVNSLNSPILFYEAVVVEMRFLSITHSIVQRKLRQALRSLKLAVEVMYEISKPI